MWQDLIRSVTHLSSSCNNCISYFGVQSIMLLIHLRTGPLEIAECMDYWQLEGGEGGRKGGRGGQRETWREERTREGR